MNRGKEGDLGQGETWATPFFSVMKGTIEIASPPFDRELRHIFTDVSDNGAK